MKVLLGTVATVVLLTVVTDLWLVHRVEARIEDRLSCRLGVDARADVDWWRGLPALATREVGTVRIGLPLEEIGGDRARTVSAQDGRLVVATGRFGAEVVLDPAVQDGRLALELAGVRIGGREVSGVLAEVVEERLGARGLGGFGLEKMPDAVRLTDATVSDDALVIEAEVDPDELSDQERTDCS